MSEDVFTDMLEDDFEESPAAMSERPIEKRIHAVRLAAGNNQFTVELCGELAEICTMALSADEWRFRSTDLERQIAERDVQIATLLEALTTITIVSPFGNIFLIDKDNEINDLIGPDAVKLIIDAQK